MFRENLVNLLEATLNCPLATQLLRNRGKLRAWSSSVLALSASSQYARLLSGRWRPRGVCAEIVVSMTSWRPRLQSLPLVLVGLLAQKQRPKTILVWLTVNDIARISPETRDLFEVWGVRFRECIDFGSHKKWLPLIAEGMADPFVICDDDVFYPRGWLEGLLREDRSDAYVGTRCHRIRFQKDNSIASYEAWEREVAWVETPAHDLFITGVGGAIIHPRRISDDFRDWDKIRKQCPQADDIWLKAAHAAAGFPCYRTKFTFPCLEVPCSQESGLLGSNVDNGGNDKKMGPLARAFENLELR